MKIYITKDDGGGGEGRNGTQNRGVEKGRKKDEKKTGSKNKREGRRVGKLG